ncbi:hypothetical protein EJ377_00740 [Chryseobacterium arthrosphaerae]|uniref:Uncharacterized protein n=1 Tax=Chryseobacterium arthrosphaerae TaxID=651561 RepID=A0A432DYD7_9FLAO|nr:hypothetical protein EJ377_00740 [Chryseobacterium arthrosphaerae]
MITGICISIKIKISVSPNTTPWETDRENDAYGSFKVQTVQNPLNVPLFSENAQEMKFVDQNMNEIQRIDFKQKFGFIRMAYAEDLQQLWLLDDSTNADPVQFQK